MLCYSLFKWHFLCLSHIHDDDMYKWSDNFVFQHDYDNNMDNVKMYL